MEEERLTSQEKARQTETQAIEKAQESNQGYRAQANHTTCFHQMQNLGDQLPDLVMACAELLGTLPKFHLRLELDLKSELTAEQVDELNRILETASDELKLR